MFRVLVRIILLVALVITCIIVFLFFPFKKALVFEYQNTDQVISYIPLLHEDKFAIKYTHSIHLSDVVESYKVTNKGEINQYELMYEDYAIGMPEGASEGEVFEQKNGKYYIKNMNRLFPYFDLRTGKVRANHRVLFKKVEYPLSNSIEPGTWVRVKVRKLNVIELLKGVNILDQK